MAGKMKLGDILTDIVAPVGAMGLAAYGGRRGNAAALIGMNAVNNIAENKRRKKLGEKVLRLADARAAADLEEQQKKYKIGMDLAQKVAPEELGFADVEAGSYWGDESALSEGGVKKQKLSEYVQNTAKPVRDETLTAVGALAEAGNPEAALELMRDQDKFKQQVALREGEYRFKEVENEKARKLQQQQQQITGRRDAIRERSADNRMTNSNRQAELDRQQREDQSIRSAGLQGQQIEATLAAKAANDRSRQIQSLQTEIRRATETLTDPMGHAMTMEEALASPMLAPYVNQLHSLLAEQGGADFSIDLGDFPPADGAGGGTPSPPPEPITPAGKNLDTSKLEPGAQALLAGKAKPARMADAPPVDGIEPGARLESHLESKEVSQGPSDREKIIEVLSEEDGMLKAALIIDNSLPGGPDHGMRIREYLQSIGLTEDMADQAVQEMVQYKQSSLKRGLGRLGDIFTDPERRAEFLTVKKDQESIKDPEVKKLRLE